MKYSLFIALSLGSLQHHQYPLHWTRNDQAIISFLVPQFLSHIHWVRRSLASLQSIRLAPAVTGWQYSATHHPARVVMGWGWGWGRVELSYIGKSCPEWQPIGDSVLFRVNFRRMCHPPVLLTVLVVAQLAYSSSGALMSFPGWNKIGAASLAYLIGIINWTFNPWIWFSPRLPRLIFEAIQTAWWHGSRLKVEYGFEEIGRQTWRRREWQIKTISHSHFEWNEWGSGIGSIGGDEGWTDQLLLLLRGDKSGM